MPKILEELNDKIKAGTVNYAAPETFDIPGVEIFAVGKWNGDTYTERDLDDIVASFTALKDRIKPYLKLGHGDDQKLLRDDELPAAGWIANVRRQGKKLLADFVRIPKKIYEVIKRGAYSRISCELWWDIPIEGQTYRRVLKAAAILGGETPAVSTLDDILSLYALDEAPVTAYGTDTPAKTYELAVEASKVKEHHMAENDELTKCHASLSEANKTIEGLKAERDGMGKMMAEKDAELKRLSEENAALKTDNVKLMSEKRSAELDQQLDKLVTEKKIVPAQREPLKVLLSALPESKEKKYKLGDKEFDGLEAVVYALIEAHAEPPVTDPVTQTGKGGDAEQQQIDAAKKYAEDHKVPFAEALKVVTRREEK